MAYMESMQAACQSAASQASGTLDSAVRAISSMISEAGSVTYTPTAVAAPSVNVTVPDLPAIDTDLGINPKELANELSKLSPDSLPDAYKKILNEHFPQADWDSLEAQFTKFLSPEFLDAQRAMAVGRLERELLKQRRALVDSFAERGFSTAPGALLSAVTELEAADQDKIIDVDLQLYTQNLDRWFEYSKFLIDSYLKAKMAEIDAFVKLTEAYINSFINLRLKGLELVAQVAEAIADLKMKAFTAQAEHAKIGVQVAQVKVAAWEAGSRERTQYTMADVQSMNQSTALRVHALGVAAKSYGDIVASLLGKDMSVMVAQGIGND